ncbi:MAG: helix-turn-helix domain-containing protein [Treponema sp.]|jgi:transcriptional regulator with XRE-family HTH domain|nr:helix-turn-helix domain-containing protein [Treponema sp.]
MDLRHLFVENLKFYRKKEGLSQIALAERCGASIGYIAEIEFGRKFPSIEMIEKIARSLRVDPYQFFKDERTDPDRENQETEELLQDLPDRVKRKITAQLLNAVSTDIDRILNPKPGGGS